jgi:hypothetical protein
MINHMSLHTAAMSKGPGWLQKVHLRCACMQANECPFPTLVMLGNHDAWTCLTAKRRKMEWGKGSWKNKEGKDCAAKVRQQLEINGDRNLAWNCKQLAGKPVTVVGARPFSKARDLSSCQPLCSATVPTEYSEPLSMHCGVRSGFFGGCRQ